MKKNKLFLIIGICLLAGVNIFFFGNVNAITTGTATIGYTGQTNGNVGSEITVKLTISNIVVDAANIGICGLGGNISFDSEYLEYISGTGMTNPYLVQIVPSNSYKIAGVDMTLASGFNTNTDVMILRFKVKKAGTTSLTFKNGQLNDCKNNRLTQNIVSKTLTLTEAAVKDTNNFLSSLSVSGQTINPVFNKNTTNYTLNVPNATTSVTINAALESTTATLNGIGTKQLNVGSNRFDIVVTAENGSKKTYTLTINRESTSEVNPDLDKDATLKSLSVSGYTLTPTFNKSINVYSLSVGDKVDGLKVEAIANSPKATVDVTGNLGWKYGVNQVTIIVTAENGSKNTYIVNVTRKDPNVTDVSKTSSDNYLTSISIDGFSLIPTFDKNISNYNAKVPYDVTDLKVYYNLSSSKAKVQITGNKSLKVNEVNAVQLKVTAEDGSIRIYTINVTRTSYKSNNYLKELNISDFSLKPAFDKNTYSYNIKVKHNTDKLNITAIPDNAKAKVEILNNENFKAGNNTVLIKVTDENDFAQIYQIYVEKPELTILGMSTGQFIMFSLLGLGLFTILIILIIMMTRKNKTDKNIIAPIPVQTPTIDFKPEFNFGSRNGTDDDIIFPNSVLNHDDKPKPVIEAEIIKEIPYDPYDDIVTKEELIDAIQEGLDTKNPEKLKMLLEQEALNRKKEELKMKDEMNENNAEDKWDF